MGSLASATDHRPAAARMPPHLVNAHRIPPLGHDEAAALAAAEFDRFLDLLQALDPDDWRAPTVCSLWDVRQIVAHVAGAAASYARWPEMARQWNPGRQRRYRQAGFSLLDALNQIQVDDRATAAPDALITELQDVGPRAIATRKRLPRWLRSLRVPMPALGVVPIGYLTDLIYTRDMWIHRLDIARATERCMTLDYGHDGRIIALMVRDLGLNWSAPVAGPSVLLQLGGPAGGAFMLGHETTPAATLALDALDFAWLVAGRAPAAESFDVAAVHGDRALARHVLDEARVPV